MGTINLDLLRRTSARTPLPTASISRAAAAAPGLALAGVGGELQKLAATGEDILEKSRDAEADAAVASFDYNRRMFDLQNEAEPGAEGFTDVVIDDYPRAVEEHVAGLATEELREDARRRLLARQPAANNTAAAFEFGSTIGLAKDRANNALSTVENRLRANPLIYAQAVADARAVIMAQPGIDATTKARMVQVAGQDLADARFEAMISAASTDAEFDAIETELRSDVWAARFDPKDYDRRLDSLATARAGVNTQLAAAGRAAVSSLETRSTAGVIVPAAELAMAESLALESGDAGLVYRIADLHAEQDAYVTARGLTLPAIRAREALLRGEERFTGAGLAPAVVIAIGSAAAATGVPASTLAAISMFEGGGGTPGATAVLDATGKPATSARGPFQFIEDTFLGVIENNPTMFPEAVGLDRAGVLALRDNVEASARAAAVLALSNTQELRRRLGREPMPTDLVTAHFLGASEAARFIRALETTPSANAAELFPVAAKNNRSIFFTNGGKGGARNLRDVRAEIADRSAAAPGRTQFAASEAYRRAGDALERGLRDDPATVANESGFAALQDLADEEAFAVRGQQMRSFFTKHHMTPDEWKPLTAAEAQALGARLAEAPVNEQLEAIEQLQALGPDMAEAALRQLDLSAPMFAFAGGLSIAGDGAEAAELALKGHKRMKDNPSQFGVKAMGGALGFEQTFKSFMGQAGIGLEPNQQEAIFDAAVAHYAETRGTTGRGFNSRAFRVSIAAVVGGAPDSVNGLTTLMPSGVSGDQIEDYLEAITTSDLLRISVDTLPPRFADGEEVTPEEMGDAQLTAIGAGLYRVTIDGQNLITMMDSAGSGLNYVVRIDAGTIESALARAEEQAERAVAESARLLVEARAADRGDLDERILANRRRLAHRRGVAVDNAEILAAELARRSAFEEKQRSGGVR